MSGGGGKGGSKTSQDVYFFLPSTCLPPMENYRRLGLHQIQQKANTESLELGNDLVYMQVICLALSLSGL